LIDGRGRIIDDKNSADGRLLRVEAHAVRRLLSRAQPQSETQHDICPLAVFQDANGFDLVDQDGSSREEPSPSFLNRIVALRIAA
jgi:hypothetical protein